MMTPKEAQLLMRERGYANSKQRVNSDMVFNHPDMKKNTNELPQLQKINIEGGESDMNWRGTDIKLPNLKKIQI